MLDPVVHAALVTLFTFGVNWLFGLLGLDLGGETATGLATVIVAYILSLFGYSLWEGIRPNALMGKNSYRPPFVSG